MIDWRKKIVRVDFTQRLPDELILKILMCTILASQDLFKLSRVNSKMSSIFQDESLWKLIIERSNHIGYYFQPIHPSNVLDSKYYSFFRNRITLPINKHCHVIPAKDFCKYYEIIYLPASAIRLTNSDAFVCVVMKKISKENTKLCLTVMRENVKQHNRMLSEFYIDYKKKIPRREHCEGETEIGGLFFMKSDTDAIVEIFNKIFV